MSPTGAEEESSTARERESATLLRAGKPMHLTARACLCEEGKHTDCFYLVTQGELEITKSIAGTPRRLLLAGPGSVLALMPAIDGSPCTVSVHATSDADLIEISRSGLLALLESVNAQDLHLARTLALSAIRRLRQATDELAQALHEAMRSTGSSGRVDITRLAGIQASNFAWSVR